MPTRMPLRCARVKLSYNRANEKEGKPDLTDGDKAPAVFRSFRRQVPSFAAAEMITCDACLRANPPTRANSFTVGQTCQ